MQAIEEGESKTRYGDAYSNVDEPRPYDQFFGFVNAPVRIVLEM